MDKNNFSECFDVLSLSDPENCPYYMISRVTLSVTSVLKKELNAANIEGVKPAYIGLLMSLWEEDGLKVVELGQKVRLEPSSMTGLIDRMERESLLYRAPDKDDRRIHRIFLTDHGRSIKNPVLNVLNNSFFGLFNGIDKKEFMQIMAFLKKILANAEGRRNG
jgi:DNA-binding MarR family transcriptional regulator